MAGKTTDISVHHQSGHLAAGSHLEDFCSLCNVLTRVEDDASRHWLKHIEAHNTDHTLDLGCNDRHESGDVSVRQLQVPVADVLEISYS